MPTRNVPEFFRGSKGTQARPGPRGFVVERVRRSAWFGPRSPATVGSGGRESSSGACSHVRDWALCTNPQTEMLSAEIRQLPSLFLDRARSDGVHDRVAGLVWRQAAEITRAALDQFLSDELTVAQAAAEYGWHPEALRRRVAADTSLNAGRPGQPRVTRATMESIGPGRGPRSPGSLTVPEGSTAEAKDVANLAADRLEDIKKLALRGRSRHG